MTGRWQYDGRMCFTLYSIKSTFLSRSATSQSSSYPVVLTRVVGPYSRLHPHLSFGCTMNLTRDPMVSRHAVLRPMGSICIQVFGKVQMRIGFTSLRNRLHLNYVCGRRGGNINFIVLCEVFKRMRRSRHLRVDTKCVIAENSIIYYIWQWFSMHRYSWL